MWDWNRWQEIWQTLRKNPVRTILTAVGVFWGIFMLVLMLGFGNGLQKGVHQNMAGLASNSFFIWTHTTSVPFDGLQAGRRIQLTNDDWQALRYGVEGIAAISPSSTMGGRRSGLLVSRGQKASTFQVQGVSPEFFSIQPVELDLGRYLNPLDEQEKRKMVMIGKNVQEMLFEAHQDPIGTYITVQGMDLKVVGIFHSLRAGDRAEWQNSTIYMPFQTFQQTFRTAPYVDSFSILGLPEVPAPELETRIKTLLAKRHRIAPWDAQALRTWNAARELSKFTGLFTGIRGLIWIVGVLTLLAGVVSVSNIMMIAVKERTREIGLRKALGATPFSIISQIVSESTLLTGVAGYCGLVAGVGLLELVGMLVASAKEGEATGMFERPEVDFEIAVIATITLMIAGSLAGLFPALHAARIRPIEALREE